MTKQEFILAYRLCEARIKKCGETVFSEAEILEDYPFQQDEKIPQGQWSKVETNSRSTFYVNTGIVNEPL